MARRLAGDDAPADVPPWWPVLTTGASVLVVAAFAAATIGAIANTAVTGKGGVANYAAAGLELVGLVGLWWRFRHPVPVLAVEVAVVGFVQVVNADEFGRFPLLLLVVSMYAVASRSEVTTTAWTAVVAWAAMWATSVAAGDSYGVIPGYAILIIAASAVGLSVRQRRALLASYRERAEQAERQRALTAAQAVTEERQRIARDLHDVVAHHVSLLVVQAGAVRESLGADNPTRGVLDSMIDGGRQAMTELRDMLDALRVDDGASGLGKYTAPAAVAKDLANRERDGSAIDSVRSVTQSEKTGVTGLSSERGAAPGSGPMHEAPPLRPGPSLAQIPDLVDGARSAGVPVSLDIQGDAVAVPPIVDTAAYRIVQEALTNVVKHAPGATTTVGLTFDRDWLSVRISNGPSSSTGLHNSTLSNTAHEGGHGIVGMTERATLAGGRLHTGALNNGFSVEAVLPTHVGTPARTPQDAEI